MFLATSNKAKRLLYLSYIDHVNAAELDRGYEEMVALLENFPAGFSMLIDLGRLVTMDADCVAGLGKIMDLLDQRGLEQVVRVIPDPAKDIGFNILARFHYHHNPRINNCETMLQAAKLLGL